MREFLRPRDINGHFGICHRPGRPLPGRWRVSAARLHRSFPAGGSTPEDPYARALLAAVRRSSLEFIPSLVHEAFRAPPQSGARCSVASQRRVALLTFRKWRIGDGAHVLVEPVHRALPGELGGGLVITRRRVVVEAVLGLRVDVAFVRDVVGLQRRLVRGPCLDQTGVQPRRGEPARPP